MPTGIERPIQAMRRLCVMAAGGATIEISDRLRALLQRSTWHSARRDRAEILALLEKEGLPIFAPVLDFQDRFGGLELFPAQDNDWMRYDLIRRDGRIERFGADWELPTSDDERVFFICADHRTAQVDFTIDQRGLICVWSGAKDPLPIASSIQTHLEQLAIIDEMVRSRPDWYWVGFGVVQSDDLRFEHRMATSGIPTAPEASDAYNTFWLSKTMCVSRRAVWGGREPTHALSAYTSSPTEAERLISIVAGTTGEKRWPPAICPMTE